MQLGDYEQIIATISYIFLNITLIFGNKIIFIKGLDYPIFIILSGSLSLFIFSSLYYAVAGFKEINPMKFMRKNYKLILLYSAIYGIGEVSQSSSLVHISISLNQIIKSTTPLFSMILSILIEKKNYHKKSIFATLLIVVGCVFTVFKNPEMKHYFGILLSMVSCICCALQAILAGLFLSNKKIKVIDVIFLTSLPSCITILPLFLGYELPLMMNDTFERLKEIFYFVCVMNIFVFFYVLSHNWLIKVTSAHYSQIIGNFKVGLLVILSAIVFKTPLNIFNKFGIFLTLVSFFTYNYIMFKYKEAIVEKLEIDLPDEIKNCFSDACHAPNVNNMTKTQRNFLFCLCNEHLCIFLCFVT
eukprot:TRINITY_DN8308_c0_g1_i1.p1 TRINITY_DN8308_c0_g1~~TRINITY_DN8308_c0_g1_i1.p1  ORF type:complete len:358 (-),score=48.47 TRINITY_DN8308_c0_g1_i1:300-1373(-)